MTFPSAWQEVCKAWSCATPSLQRKSAPSSQPSLHNYVIKRNIFQMEVFVAQARVDMERLWNLSDGEDSARMRN